MLFRSKSGARNRVELEDKRLASVLSKRLKRGGPLFDTNEGRVTAYLHRVDGTFLPKDLRTVKATEVALRKIKELPVPKTVAEYKRLRNQVGDVVSAQLCNTRSVALSSYVPPEVFAGWDRKFGGNPLSKKGDVEGHHFHGNQWTEGQGGAVRDEPRPGGTPGPKEYRDHFIRNILAGSRTAQGISDTSVSADKPKLNVEGEALAKKVRENAEACFELAWRGRVREYKDGEAVYHFALEGRAAAEGNVKPEDVERFIRLANETANRGLTQEGAGTFPWRSWNVEKFDYVPAETIQPAMKAYCAELARRIQVHEDPVKTAAWHEQTFDMKIHPFADGVGRTRQVVTAMLMMRNGNELPTYPDREVYYSHAKDSPERFESFFRTLYEDKKMTDVNDKTMETLDQLERAVELFSMAVLLKAGDFDPDKHPRGEGGRFATTGSGGKPGEGESREAVEKPIPPGPDREKLVGGQALTGLSPELTKALDEIERQYPPVNPAGNETILRQSDSRYAGPDDLKIGTFSKEREALHDRIVRGLREGVPGNQPDKTFVILGGGTASGKSTAIRRGLVKLPPDTVKIDSDAIKSELPEYQAMLEHRAFNQSAGYVHEESSYLGKRILGECAASGQNYMLDGTGDGRLESLKKKCDEAHAAGYKVVAEYSTVDVERSLAWEKDRSADPLTSGRGPVPASVTMTTHRRVSQVMPEALKQVFFDEARLWDNQRQKDGKPTLVMEHKDGKTVIHDQALW